VLCPTCRTRTLVADIAYVDAGRAAAAAGGGGDAAAGAAEAAAAEAEDGIVVRGSYSTKARRPFGVLSGPLQQARMDVTWEGEGSEKSDSGGRDGLAAGGLAGTSWQNQGSMATQRRVGRMGEPPWVGSASAPLVATAWAQQSPLSVTCRRSGRALARYDQGPTWPTKLQQVTSTLAKRILREVQRPARRAAAAPGTTTAWQTIPVHRHALQTT